MNPEGTLQFPPSGHAQATQLWCWGRAGDPPSLHVQLHVPSGQRFAPAAALGSPNGHLHVVHVRICLCDHCVRCAVPGTAHDWERPGHDSHTSRPMKEAQTLSLNARPSKRSGRREPPSAPKSSLRERSWRRNAKLTCRGTNCWSRARRTEQG